MKTIHTSGKRKTAVARATLKDGSGIVRVNKMLIDNFEPKMARLKLREPLLLAGDFVNNLDIDVNVFGGGVMSQADAARLAIAKALLKHPKGKKLREAYLTYDRNMVVADVRRREASKPNRHGQARAKRQKSYR